MSNDFFEFKQFTIWQDKSAMKVGTDSVLLGAWVNAQAKHYILDVGAGTGILSLMMAQRSNAIIDAVEIDCQAAMQATHNFERSKWSNRLSCVRQSFQEFCVDKKPEYDLIISNPPYFSDGLRSGNEQRAKARHSDNLELSDLILLSKELLVPGGSFALILPYSLRVSFLEQISCNGLWVSHEARIKPRQQEDFNRVMFEVVNIMPESYSIEEITIELDRRHSYHQSFLEYTKEFYLDDTV